MATRRRADTRARLLEAAAEVFVERGFGATSVEQVCEAAGFTRGAFYSNFSSLDELLLALVAQRHAAVVAGLGAALEQIEPAPVEDLTAFVGEIVRAHLADRRWQVLQTELALHALRHPAVAEQVAEHRADLRRRVGELIAHAAGRAGRSLTVGPEELARAVLALVEGTRFQTYLDPAATRTDRLLLTAVLEQYTRAAGPDGPAVRR
ncbi:TetR/AcrR family transcriptional regulator [Pseudonocardia oroxyli]|uniref:Transcriptional regulator, TetR family n=1 Tax=Pseudonocardia oroxyli TaxID=366584 RepID=A0A1G7KEU8_PSEOR|nr:TetR/AcrR family transcriptional regulator [Pseudonocardia oroxyli]SDF35712.1 transcriptional regulator, TetR family [Pseudonocardia oroxyli]